MLPVVELRGRRGDWTVEVAGERLPVLHDSWRGGPDCCDPMKDAKVHGKRYRDYVDLLRNLDRAVIQRDWGGGDLSRTGYHGIYRIADRAVREDGSITLRILDKIADAAK